MADAPAPAPAVDLTTSILPAGGVDANSLDASFTLVSRGGRVDVVFGAVFLFHSEREEEGKEKKNTKKSGKKLKKKLELPLSQQSAYLVFFMHCGFAMLSVGCVRARFSKHICILILLDACASAIGFFLVRFFSFFFCF